MACELRLLTRQDFVDWFGHPPSNTLRGVAGVEDGKLLGIGGVVYEYGLAKAFMELKPEAKAYKRDIVRGARAVLNMMRREHWLVYAVAGDSEQAPRFLQHFGFQKLKDSRIGEIYQWRR